MREESESRAVGPRQHALEKVQAVEKASSQVSRLAPKFRLWVDGVLDIDVLSNLRALEQVVDAVQYENYVLASLSSSLDGMRLRSLLDPNVFVMQKDPECTVLEINFNPTPDQINALRRLHDRIVAISLTTNAH